MISQILTTKIPGRVSRLDELSHNVWWSWHREPRGLFRSLDYALWRESGHNPVKMLYEISAAKLQSAAEDPEFQQKYDKVMAEYDTEISASNTWFASAYPGMLSGPVAYFSMEFAIHNSLPIYAGGLGILAGDLCKEASDLGLPLVGIGFMYPQGYFHQHISPDGWQQEIYQQLRFNEAPINQVFSQAGKRVLATVKLAERYISIAVWRVRVGRVDIYLLDTNLEENTTEDRDLSARLYTSDREIRIKQEIVLGIGGVRVLRALGIRPSVWHANEGHSAFMGLERIRENIGEGVGFAQALQNVKASSVFTTHTPVACGHDCFTGDLMLKYFREFWETLGIDQKTFMDLGKADNAESFNMTALAMRTADHINAVSQLHETETRKMWQVLWPGLSQPDLPITHITNGVHVPTWIAHQWVGLFEKYLGSGWEDYQDAADLWAKVLNIPDEEIWSVHQYLKGRLLEVALARAQKRWAEGEVTAQQVVAMGALLSPQVLTIGYSRRFTEYKRPALILSDLPRLKKILNNPWRPVQIIFAGKSHPADFSGKYLLHKIYEGALDREFQGRVAFIEDYDMHIARYLVHGIDVWLNDPLRLQEASGTSGMKASINGIPNLSVRDGWWEEGYNGTNGWAIGGGPEMAFSPEQDKADSESIYRLLEEEIVPSYYRQDRAGVPHEWIKVVKQAMSSVMPNFCSARMVKEYTSKMYAAVPESLRLRP
jgi:glycogen phosphorylase